MKMEMELLRNVTLVQAIVRRFLALKYVESLRFAKDTEAALAIQTSYQRFAGDPVHFPPFCSLSDVVLCQSAVRRFLAYEHTTQLRYERDSKAALLI